MKDAQNIGSPPKRVKNKDGWTWRVIRNLMKKVRLGDEIGFRIGRTHWVLRKGGFTK
jgi:hypothetical protein